MNISRKTEGNIDIINLQGRLDINSASDLKEASREIIDKKNCRLILNMEKVDFVNSAGLGALVSLFKDARSSRGEIRLVNLAPYVKEIFDITQLSSIFNIYDDEKAALSSF